MVYVVLIKYSQKSNLSSDFFKEKKAGKVPEISSSNHILKSVIFGLKANETKPRYYLCMLLNSFIKKNKDNLKCLSKGHCVMGSGKRTRVVNMERMLFRYMINLCALSFIYKFRLRTSPAVSQSVIQISWRRVLMQRMNTNKLLRFLFSKCDIYHTVKSLRRSCSHMSQIKIGCAGQRR